VREMLPPSAESIFDHVYTEPHAQVVRERAEFVEYHAAFGEEVAK